MCTFFELCLQCLSPYTHALYVHCVPNVLSLYSRCILFELCRCSLYDMLHKSDQPLPPAPDLFRILREVPPHLPLVAAQPHSTARKQQPLPLPLPRSRGAPPLVLIPTQVALGMIYLHTCDPPVLHLDLKSANILLDEHNTAKATQPDWQSPRRLRP